MLVHSYDVIRLSVGIVFLISTVGKLWNPKQFVDGLDDYKVLPSSTVSVLAIVLICLEAWLSFAHLQGRSVRVAGIVGLALCFVFSIAVGINLRRGRTIACHCFWGSDDEVISSRTLIRLLFLAVGEIVLLLSRQSNFHVTFTVQLVELFWAVFVLTTCAWLLSFGDIRELLIQKRSNDL